jgi:hypothetical protein
MLTVDQLVLLGLIIF